MAKFTTVNSPNPLVSAVVQLQRFPGKGGWTYVALPQIKNVSTSAFNWMEVTGTIDDYQLVAAKLMPMGNGVLFIPVKSEIRKAIKKEVGDSVKLVLFANDSSVVSTADLEACIADVPEAYHHFKSLKLSDRKQLLQWMAQPTTDEQKVNRINKVIDHLLRKMMPEIGT